MKVKVLSSYLDKSQAPDTGTTRDTNPSESGTQSSVSGSEFNEVGILP